MLESYFLLCTVICIFTVTVAPYNFHLAYTTFYAKKNSIGDTKMTTNL